MSCPKPRGEARWYVALALDHLGCVSDVPTDPKTWSTVLQEASKLGDVTVQPHELTIDYETWHYCMRLPDFDIQINTIAKCERSRGHASNSTRGTSRGNTHWLQHSWTYRYDNLTFVTHYSA